MVTAQDMKNALEWAEYKGVARGKAEGLAEGEVKGKAEGLAEGEAKGRAEGEAKGKAEVVKTMLADNVEISVIMKYTGLSEEEIIALK